MLILGLYECTLKNVKRGHEKGERLEKKYLEHQWTSGKIGTECHKANIQFIFCSNQHGMVYKYHTAFKDI